MANTRRGGWLSYQRPVGTLVALAVLFLVSACGQAATHAGGPAASSGPATKHHPREPMPVIVAGRLASPFTYVRGSLRLDPPPASYQPAISAKQAYKIFESGVGGAYLGHSSKQTPEVFLALYTTIGYGPGVGLDNPNAAGWDKVPIWVIRFTHVETYPSGAGDTAGASTDIPQTPVYDDLLAVLRSDDGHMLSLYNALPDDHAMPAPTR